MKPLILNTKTPLVQGYKKGLTLLKYDISVNDEYDRDTVEATKFFQRKMGLDIDGKAGEKTISALVRELARVMTIEQYKIIFDKHRNFRFSGNPQMPNKSNSIVIFGFRCNREPDFNKGKWNDTLVVFKSFNTTNPSSDAITEWRRVVMACTTDPYQDRYGIAHLRQGCWNSYVIRPHRWQKATYSSCSHLLPSLMPRYAFCQDADMVEILRTDGKGNKLSEHWGYFGINIHESSGDTSLGCTIPKDRCEWVNKVLIGMMYDVHAKKINVRNKTDITYCLVNYDKLLIEYLSFI